MWSLEQPDWHCKIDEGSIGLLSSRWSPDGRHILNTTEFHVSVKLVRAWMLAFMRIEVCLCTCLSGFNCCWPVRKGDLKIARHQSLTQLVPQPPHPTPPYPPPDACIQPDFIAALPLASCHTRVSSTSGTWVQCVCILNIVLVCSLAAGAANDAAQIIIVNLSQMTAKPLNKPWYKEKMKYFGNQSNSKNFNRCFNLKASSA